MTPATGHGRNLGYTPAVGVGEEVTAARLGSAPAATGGARPWSDVEPEPQSAVLTRQALLEAVNEVSGSLGDIAGWLQTLEARPPGLRGVSGILDRSITYAGSQLPWLHSALGTVTTLADVASEVHEPDMQLALLRMTGPRLQAALSGATLLSAWIDFLNLADAVLRQCPAYSTERLFMDMERVRQRIEPSVRALASGDPGKVQAAAVAMPELMGQLTQEFHSIREAARVATERSGQIMAAAQLIEVLTLVSVMKVALPRLPPSAPALAGVGLVMGANGVMMGTRVVVSAEWVEMMRRLVQAGVLSSSAVSAAVRIHAGQVMMAQANQGLPQGVREALGDGPEVRAMHETGKAGAGMAEPPRHHVLPDEFRAWFEKRGFTGAMSIDQFCVELEVASHQALHGGGNWRLGRTWPGEWNQLIMKVLRDAEADAGRMLTRSEILKLVAKNMRFYKIPMNFTPGRRR
jgi:hypothetical protein